MTPKPRLFDDLSRVAEGAVGTLGGMRAEIEALVRQRVERLISGMDLVRRDEFEAVWAMAREAREAQEDLAHRVALLEEQLAETKTKAKAKPAQTARARRIATSAPARRVTGVASSSPTAGPGADTPS